MAPEPGQSRIFISYRREDSAGHVLALLPALRRHFGADRIFKDTDNIPPGVNFLKFIKRELESCSVLLAILGKEWLTVQDPRLKRRRLDNPDDFLRLEVATALKSERIRVIPVLVERSMMPAPEDLPPDLAELALRNALELSDTRWESDVERLIQAIHAAAEVPASPAPAQTPRSGISDLHRRRAREIAAHLQAAREAFEAHDYESTMLACEKALLLDPQGTEALELLERTRKAIDEQKITEWLAGAQQLLGRGDVAGASELIDQALSLDNTSEPALTLRQELLRLRREREQERERARVTLAAVTRAQTSLDEDDFDAAVRHADDALELEPQSKDAQEIRSKAIAALAERRRQREHKRHAQQTVAEARAMFEAGRHQEGLRLLREFSPAHELVSQALLELQQEADALEQSRSQIVGLMTKAETAAAAGRFQDAIALLHELEGKEPGRADVAALLRRAESGLKAAAAARQARQEADARLSEASAKFQKQEYGAARQLVEVARKLDPQHPEANRWLRRIDDALAEQKIAAGRRAAIQTALAEASANIEKGQFEAAIAHADTALAIEPTLEDARSLRERASAALAEIRKREAHEHFSKQTVEEAQRMFTAGNHNAALELLQRFSPPHALVTQALLALRAQFQEIEQRRRQREEEEAKRREEAARAAAERRQAQAVQILARGQANLEREDFEGALLDAHEVLRLDPRSVEAQALRSAASTAVEERIRRIEQDRLAQQAAEKARAQAEEEDRRRLEAEARARDQQDRIQRELADAQAAFAAGKFRQAKRTASGILKVSPDNALAQSLHTSATREIDAATPEFWSTRRLTGIGSAVAVLLAIVWIGYGGRPSDSQPGETQTPPSTAVTPPPPASGAPEIVARGTVSPPAVPASTATTAGNTPATDGSPSGPTGAGTPATATPPAATPAARGTGPGAARGTVERPQPEAGRRGTTSTSTAGAPPANGASLGTKPATPPAEVPVQVPPEPKPPAAPLPPALNTLVATTRDAISQGRLDAARSTVARIAQLYPDAPELNRLNSEIADAARAADERSVAAAVAAYADAFSSRQIAAIRAVYPAISAREIKEVESLVRDTRSYEMRITITDINLRNNRATVRCTIFHNTITFSGKAIPATNREELVFERKDNTWVRVD